jgi:hypothetical protein
MKHLSCKICPFELTILSSAANPSSHKVQTAPVKPLFGSAVSFWTGILVKSLRQLLPQPNTIKTWYLSKHYSKEIPEMTGVGGCDENHIP